MMTDRTVYAEALIIAVAKAFYEDTEICLLNILLRDKYLRDDDMSSRLSLPPKETRRTLEFLRRERLVKWELVDDLSEGGSQTTKFWYVDINIAVHTIRLRLFMLDRSLEHRECMARSSSMYLCPGYKTGVCNGKYTETEAQNVVDPNTGLFLCHECAHAHQCNPYPPPIETYILTLVDNSKHLKKAMDISRRVHAQFSAKRIGNVQLRTGIYDLLHKVANDRSAGPLSSNLPSENRAMNIGSQRWKGTGRTYGIKAKKLAEKAPNNHDVEDEENIYDLSVKAYFRKYRRVNTKDTNEEDQDLVFLNNAMGQQLAFELELGGGVRANLLAKTPRNGSKLLDTAATRVSVEMDVAQWMKTNGRKKREEERKNRKGRMIEFGCDGTATFSFMRNNLGFEREDRRDVCYDKLVEKQGRTKDIRIILETDEEEFDNMMEEERRIKFLAFYKKELSRQKKKLDGGQNEEKKQREIQDKEMVCEYSCDMDENANNNNNEDANNLAIAWEDG